MRQILLFIFVSCIIFSCIKSDHINYEQINSKDISLTFLYDSTGFTVIDTFPVWLKSIKRYSLNGVDTSTIKLSNSDLALDFARHKLDSVYGQRQMDLEEPFNVSLIDNKFWYFRGTFPKTNNSSGVINYGGVAELIISKYDGDILYLIHGK